MSDGLSSLPSYTFAELGLDGHGSLNLLTIAGLMIFVGSIVFALTAILSSLMNARNGGIFLVLLGLGIVLGGTGGGEQNEITVPDAIESVVTVKDLDKAYSTGFARVSDTYGLVREDSHIRVVRLGEEQG